MTLRHAVVLVSQVASYMFTSLGKEVSLACTSVFFPPVDVGWDAGVVAGELATELLTPSVVVYPAQKEVSAVGSDMSFPGASWPIFSLVGSTAY